MVKILKTLMIQNLLYTTTVYSSCATKLRNPDERFPRIAHILFCKITLIYF